MTGKLFPVQSSANRPEIEHEIRCKRRCLLQIVYKSFTGAIFLPVRFSFHTHTHTCHVCVGLYTRRDFHHYTRRHHHQPLSPRLPDRKSTSVDFRPSGHARGGSARWSRRRYSDDKTWDLFALHKTEVSGFRILAGRNAAR